jgi:TonB family protein
MVPPEGIDKIQPTTLPADFGEWDSGDAPEPEPVAVPAFDRFPSPPAAQKQAPKTATARVAVLPVVERPPAAPPRKPVKRQPEPEPVFELPQSRAMAEDLDEPVKGKNKMVIYAAVAVVVLIGGGVGYWRMSSKPVTPTQPVATQMSTTAVTNPSSSSSLKPSATPSETTTQTTPVATETQETPTGLGRQSSDAMNRQLNAPSRLKSDLQALGGSNQPAPTTGFSAAGMDGMGNSNPVFTPGSGPSVKVEAPKRVTISNGIAVGLLVQKTAPIYPPIAKSAHVSGTVVIQATISRTGSIENLRVVSGPTMLRQSALDAVKTWRFRPYLLDGQPVEVETTVNVVFNLN